jgi:hypothetical protein
MYALPLSCDDLTRRHFVGRLAKTCLGVSVMNALSPRGLAAPFAEASKLKQAATAKRVIYLYMSGGMSHLETEEERRDLQRVRKRNSLIVLALLMLGGTVLLIYLVNPSALPSFVRDVLSFLLGRG